MKTAHTLRSADFAARVSAPLEPTARPGTVGYNARATGWLLLLLLLAAGPAARAQVPAARPDSTLRPAAELMGLGHDSLVVLATDTLRPRAPAPRPPQGDFC